MHKIRWFLFGIAFLSWNCKKNSIEKKQEFSVQWVRTIETKVFVPFLLLFLLCESFNKIFSYLYFNKRSNDYIVERQNSFDMVNVCLEFIKAIQFYFPFATAHTSEYTTLCERNSHTHTEKEMARKSKLNCINIYRKRPRTEWKLKLTSKTL